jgi:hypothetical protein
METTISKKNFRLETLIIILLGVAVVFFPLCRIPIPGKLGEVYRVFTSVLWPTCVLIIYCLMLSKKTGLKKLAKVGVILAVCAIALSLLRTICWQFVWHMQLFDLYGWRPWSIFQNITTILYYLIWIPGILMLAVGSDIKKGLKIILFILIITELLTYIMYPIAYRLADHFEWYDAHSAINTGIGTCSYLIEIGIFIAAIFLSGITKRKAVVDDQLAAEEIKAASCEVIESADEATAEEATVETEVAAEPAIEEETVVVEEQVNEEKPVAE